MFRCNCTADVGALRLVRSCRGVLLLVNKISRVLGHAPAFEEIMSLRVGLLIRVREVFAYRHWVMPLMGSQNCDTLLCVPILPLLANVSKVYKQAGTLWGKGALGCKQHSIERSYGLNT